MQELSIIDDNVKAAPCAGGLGRVFLANRLMDKAAYYLRLRAADLIGPSRRAELVEARWAIWHVMYHHHGLKHTTIGNRFNRDAATIYHGLAKADELMANVHFVALVEHLRVEA